ncbi:MAG: PH domain-containing protein [Candidatus Micrarchaeota archaeon]
MLIRENIEGARHLDPRIRIRWFLWRLILLLPIFAALYVLFYVALPALGHPAGIQHDVIFWLLAIASVALNALFISLRYRKFVYALREKDLIIQRGIVEKLRYVVPYEKIQNVTVSRDFIDVLLGTGTLHIETAAHMVLDNEIRLPGIQNDSDLVNELVARSKAAKAGGADEVPMSDGAVLREILQELRGIRSALKKEEPKKEPSPITHKEARGSARPAEELKNARVLFEKPGAGRKKGI